jgi:hypothetical protein
MYFCSNWTAIFWKTEKSQKNCDHNNAPSLTRNLLLQYRACRMESSWIVLSESQTLKSYYPIPSRDSISRPIARQADAVQLDHAVMAWINTN